jgi:hypothetical protein
VGFFQLGGFNCQVEDPLYLFDSITIFPESGFGELPNHHGDFPCRKEPCLYTPMLKELLVCWKDGEVIQGSGRGYCG